LVFSKTLRLTIERVCAWLLILILPGFASGIEVRPKAGFSFDYFGEKYQLTDDRDTVTTISDYGGTVGLFVSNAVSSASRLRADGDVYYGRETARARLLVRGELRQGASSFLLDQDAVARIFHEGGDYSLSSDSFQNSSRLSWERRFDESTTLRVHHLFEAVVYSDPDQYNLDSFLHRPGVSVRRKLGFASEVRAGYQLGWRDVPDSSQLDSMRHTGELDFGMFFGSFSVDFSERLERRDYDEPTPRESSWESRSDGSVEWLRPGRITGRLRHDLEIVRYDSPDDLDFDFTRFRVSAGPSARVVSGVEVSVEPLFGMLTSRTAPDEDYLDLAIEVGVEVHFAGTWINLSDEVGRRDYEREASGETIDLVNPQAAPSNHDPLYSDSTYNRLTALVSADVGRSITIHLFANWEPENHRLDRYDSDSRMVSGGVEYRF
jgi:hypothetical protein